MKTDRFDFKGDNKLTSSKLMEAIESLPEETLKGLPTKDKTIIELVINDGNETVTITPPYILGERLIVQYPKNSKNQRASRECACFEDNNFRYRVIF